MMSQLPQFGPGLGNGPPRRLAVIHRQGAEWRVVAITRDDRDGTIRVESAMSVAATDLAALSRAVSGIRADVVLRVLPGGTVVCRTVPIPSMEPSVLEEALDLQAEAALPAHIDAHRRAAAMLPWAEQMPDEAEALVLGWPGEEPDAPVLEEEEDDGADFCYAPTMACLVEVLARTHGEGMACYLDRDEGAFELLMHRFGRTALRTVRINGDADPEEWGREMRRIVTETAMSIGLDPAGVEPWREELLDQAARFRQMQLIDENARSALFALLEGDVRRDDLEWWKKYGLAILAGVGALGPRRKLFALRGEPAAERRQPIIELLHWIDSPGRAAFVLLAALLVVVLMPLGAAWGRYAILNAKAGDIQNIQQMARRASQQEQFYQAPNSRRWPMTKLLADLSGSAPPEVQLDETIIDSESGEIRLKGIAPDSERQSSFQEALGALGVFHEIDLNRLETKGSSVEFEMTLSLADPLREAERQYTTPLAVHLYGEELAEKVQPGEYERTMPSGRGGGFARSRGSGGGAASSFGRSNRGAGELFGGGDGAGLFGTAASLPGGEDEDEGEGGGDEATASSDPDPDPDPDAVPEPISAEEIDALDADEAMRRAQARADLLYDEGIDESTRTRLRDEMARLMNRVRNSRAEDEPEQ